MRDCEQARNKLIDRAVGCLNGFKTHNPVGSDLMWIRSLKGTLDQLETLLAPYYYKDGWIPPEPIFTEEWFNKKERK